MKPTTNRQPDSDVLKLPLRIECGTGHFYLVDAESIYLGKWPDTKVNERRLNALAHAANSLPAAVAAMANAEKFLSSVGITTLDNMVLAREVLDGLRAALAQCKTNGGDV